MKKITTIFIAFYFPFMALAQETTSASPMLNRTYTGGIGIGTIIAIVASWSRNKSIMWALLHGLLGWIYVIYFLFTRTKQKQLN